jgi:hypothetical protein
MPRDPVDDPARLPAARVPRATRRTFLISLAAPAALAASCGRSGRHPVPQQAGAIGPARGAAVPDASADLREVRAYVLPLEANPAFVFSTGFRNVR